MGSATGDNSGKATQKSQSEMATDRHFLKPQRSTWTLSVVTFRMQEEVAATRFSLEIPELWGQQHQHVSDDRVPTYLVSGPFLR